MKLWWLGKMSCIPLSVNREAGIFQDREDQMEVALGGATGKRPCCC